MLWFVVNPPPADSDGPPMALSTSLFEYEAGKNVSFGDKVKILWTETEGTGKFGPVTYRNLKSIMRQTDNALSGS